MDKNKTITLYCDFLNFLKKNGGFKRLGKPFKTANGYYFYDVGT